MRAAAIIVGILMASMSSHVVAETSWILVGKNRVFIVQVDTSRIKKTGNIVRYWIKTTVTDVKDDTDYFVSIEETDCLEEKTRSIQTTAYYKSGKQSLTVQGENGWTFVTPDTMGETIIKFTCSK